MIEYKYLISEEGKSQAISRELANLAFLTPNNSSIFEVIKHPTNGFTALVVADLDYQILVHPNKDLQPLINLLSNPPYDPEVIAQLTAYVESIVIPQLPPEPPSGYVLGRFPFRNVVEGYVDIHDAQYMTDNGWFTE